MIRPDQRTFEMIMLLITTLVALAGTPADLSAQATPTESDGPGTIDGYGAVAWGADSATIVEAVGTPDTVRTIEALNARALVYSDQRLGRTRGSIGYLVAPTDGLLRVMYLSSFGSGDVCLDIYQNLRDTVAQMYPELSKRERMYNQSDDLSFCTAFQLGLAGARTIWRDSATGARAWVALDLAAGVVRVSFESPSYEPRPSDSAAAREGRS